MPTHADVRRLALALAEAYEAPHFDATSFRVNKKIFCTMGENCAGIVLKFTAEDQHNLAAGDDGDIKPVAGYWGRSGWADVQVAGMAEAKLQNLLYMSWAMVAPKRLLKS